MGDWVTLKFKYITGSPERYRKWGCKWMLEREKSGGGCTINLAVHYIDLFQYLTKEGIKEVRGFLSNKMFREEIEDYSLLLLKSDKGTLGEIESGYISSGLPEDRDSFTIYTEKREIYFQNNVVRWIDRSSGTFEERRLPSQSLRELFVRNILWCFREEKPPVANLKDAYEVLKVIDRIYE